MARGLQKPSSSLVIPKFTGHYCTTPARACAFRAFFVPVLGDLTDNAPPCFTSTVCRTGRAAMASKYPCSRSLAEAPLVVPSAMRFYTHLPTQLSRKNPTLFRDVVAVLNHIDRQRTQRLRELMEAK